MTDSVLDSTPTAGWAGFSAGGVVSTLGDQLTWGDALYRSGKILDADSLAQMLNIDNQFNTGLGAFPTCPCSTVDGVKVYSSIGHNGGQATVQYAPAQDVVIALNLTESMWTDDLTQSDVAAVAHLSGTGGDRGMKQQVDTGVSGTASNDRRPLRIGVVTAFPPGRNSLNEFGFHLVKHLAQQDEVERGAALRRRDRRRRPATAAAGARAAVLAVQQPRQPAADRPGGPEQQAGRRAAQPAVRHLRRQADRRRPGTADAAAAAAAQGAAAS